MKNIVLFLCQLGLICLIYAASQWFVNLVHLPIPGSVFGMILLFLLLLSGVLKVSYIEKATSFLNKHLAFFFIPFAVGLMNYGQLIRTSGVQLLVMIVGSTVIGLIVTSGLTQVLTGKAGAKRGQSDNR
ncbi:CidA/LrgA family protein [Niallia sp. Krafla_26]|uniref:CidA/LrgA family protein n=1 Tax=Niallia sp. Krafla_26 TaxID=3064703 RepID=UPI003D176A3C